MGKRTQFQQTPLGTKTARMLEVEKRLGVSLEDDYREHVVEKGWGQRRLANRWGVKRQTIFDTSVRGRKRSWVQMLGYPSRRGLPAFQVLL